MRICWRPQPRRGAISYLPLGGGPGNRPPASGDRGAGGGNGVTRALDCARALPDASCEVCHEANRVTSLWGDGPRVLPTCHAPSRSRADAHCRHGWETSSSTGADGSSTTVIHQQRQETRDEPNPRKSRGLPDTPPAAPKERTRGSPATPPRTAGLLRKPDRQPACRDEPAANSVGRASSYLPPIGRPARAASTEGGNFGGCGGPVSRPPTAAFPSEEARGTPPRS